MEKYSSILEKIFFQNSKNQFSKTEKFKFWIFLKWKNILPFWKKIFHFGKISAILEKYSLFWKISVKF
jgi:hypothetical protein